MNEIKIATQVKSENEQKLLIKIDTQTLGLNWDNETFVRVKSYKKDGKLILQKVGGKYDKQVSYKITNTGGSISAHQKGIYVTQKNTRFAKLIKSKITNAAARMLNKNTIEVYLPNEIFA